MTKVQEVGAARPSGPLAPAASGALGMVAGPFAGLGFLALLALLGVLDPDQNLPFLLSLFGCALAPSLLVLPLAKIDRSRSTALGLALGSAITCLTVAVPIALVELLFGDF